LGHVTLPGAFTTEGQQEPYCSDPSLQRAWRLVPPGGINAVGCTWHAFGPYSIANPRGHVKPQFPGGGGHPPGPPPSPRGNGWVCEDVVGRKQGNFSPPHEIF
jgi:hypothetical protein